MTTGRSALLRGLPVGEQWPTMKARTMRRVIERVCGPPLRQRGSHAQYRTESGKRITFGMHDGEEVDSGLVRDILVGQLGLPIEQARYVARKGRLPR